MNGLVGSEVGDSLAGSTPAPSAQPRWQAFCFDRVAAPMMERNSGPADRVTALCGHVDPSPESGSTAIAALRERRDCSGAEPAGGYVDKMVGRIHSLCPASRIDVV